jgi:hypothetical protein
MEFASPCGGPVGDVMNATARVESLTKYYGLLMLTTRACCADSFRLSFPAEPGFSGAPSARFSRDPNSNPFQSDVLVMGTAERDELVWLRQGSVAENGGGAGPEPCAKWR